jgi:hypothetical protein
MNCAGLDPALAYISVQFGDKAASEVSTPERSQMTSRYQSAEGQGIAVEVGFAVADPKAVMTEVALQGCRTTNCPVLDLGP